MSTALRGRGERVASGVWRLRLPLPWAGIPHVNAWALERSDGVVLVDCGLDGPEALPETRARAWRAGCRPSKTCCLLVCTHAHPDHYGLAARVVERARCELWMHPRHAHVTAALIDPEGATRLRRAAARRSGVPQRSPPVRPVVRGHAASRPRRCRIASSSTASKCSQRRRLARRGDSGPRAVPRLPLRAAAQLLISGDHLLERPARCTSTTGSAPTRSASTSRRSTLAEELAAETCLPGHGAPFGDIPGVLAAARAEVTRRLERRGGACAATG